MSLTYRENSKRQSSVGHPAYSPSTRAWYMCFIAGLFAAVLAGIDGSTHTALSEQRLPSSSAGLVSPKPTEWPFSPWSYAKAYTFNFFPARHGVQLRILENGKWSQHLHSEVRLSHELAISVARLVNSTQGSFETSKCPFPRHAFVFFNESDVPVGSVDVCFECDDLFTWPDFNVSPESKYGSYEDIELDKAENALEAVLPRGGLWTEFRSALIEYKSILREVGLPIAWQ